MIRGRLTLLFALLAAGLFPKAASADLVVTVQDATAVEGTSGFFDVFVTSDADPGTPDMVPSYSLVILGIEGATYTDVNEQTSAPNGYIFPGNELAPDTLSPDLAYVDLLLPGTEVSTGQVYGVGRVFFDALMPGVYSIVIDANRSGFFNGDGDDLVVLTYSPGTLTITPVAVPEPSSAILLALAGAVGYGIRRRRASRAAAA